MMRGLNSVLACVVSLILVADVMAADRPGRPEGRRRHRQRVGGGRARPMLPLMQALDADKDGEISTAEIANAVAALLTLDKDNDGKLSREELRPQKPGPEELVARLMKNDKDGDGKVSKEELPERMRRILKRGDTNGDEAIDKDEAKKLAEQMVDAGKERKERKEGRHAKRSRRPDGE